VYLRVEVVEARGRLLAPTVVPFRPLRDGRRPFISPLLVPTLLLTLLVFGCGDPPEDAGTLTRTAQDLQTEPNPEERVEVPPPPFSSGIYPCSNCHGMIPPNPTQRDLTAFHTDIGLHHDEEHRWCLDCHDGEDRDQLHLASGALVPFEESYRLCGQCHGEKYRDWRAGIHGRRSGNWNGHKTYLLCAHCHNPHQPRFQPIEPMAAPIAPSETVGGGHER